jgi:hypothetical protein
MKVNGSALLNTAEDNQTIRSHHRRAVHDAISFRRPPIPAPSRVEVLLATHQMQYLEQHL